MGQQLREAVDVREGGRIDLVQEETDAPFLLIDKAMAVGEVISAGFQKSQAL